MSGWRARLSVWCVLSVLGCDSTAPKSPTPSEPTPTPVSQGAQARYLPIARVEGYGNPLTGELWARSTPVPTLATQSGVGVSAQALGMPGYCPVSVESDGQVNNNPTGTFEFYNQFDATGAPGDAPSFDATECYGHLPVGMQDATHLTLFNTQGVGCALQHIGNFSGKSYDRVMLDIDVYNGLTGHAPYGPPFTTGTVVTPQGRNAPYQDLGLWDFGPMPSGTPGQTTGPHLKEMWIYFQNGNTTDFNWWGYLLGEVLETCGNSQDDDCDGVVDNGCSTFTNGAGCFYGSDCATDVCLGASVVSGLGEGGGTLGDDVPGVCTCEATDSDADHVGNACDNCPSLANTSQLDADSDGAGNACDGCPNDASKLAPGACGCGTADTDTDFDTAPDCIDGCPGDGTKTDPGMCGCESPDTDSDGDGTADCLDGCPTDTNKTSAGICGCGVLDTDTDVDGVPDCNDGCPTDVNKTMPAVCGCGFAETDTDNDSVPNCVDGCPFDMSKLSPGDCGCGMPDVDMDMDGNSDCTDDCPGDPLKSAPGLCGCGTPDTDTDFDGTPDCTDGCITDAGKQAPGVCGCHDPDVDSDLDTVLDCQDGCPGDGNKNHPGVCGCHVPDTDSDFDGTHDCNDGCISDSSKQAPGVCGCNMPDTDSDFDGTADCVDDCPDDPSKILPGECGCDVSDADTDLDGVVDCYDDCPLDPAKVMPGVCGCGESDVDGDGDATPTCIDNCPFTWNSNQWDADVDGHGDVCDNCISDPNPAQDNGDADEWGDVCDNCPGDYTLTPEPDSDGDLTGDVCDNCAGIYNWDQADDDSDGHGNICDNCPVAGNPSQADDDFDFVGNNCDNCPFNQNNDQGDFDMDGEGNVCDVPGTWLCSAGYYGTLDGCDCGCGASDPDCIDSTSAACEYCNDGGSCGTQRCVDSISALDNAHCPDAGWTCGGLHWGAGDGCECGCGVVDPDCPDAELSSCDWCTTEGSCGSTYCSNTNIDYDNNAVCVPDAGMVPSGWRCTPSYYGDGPCDCGCGVLDMDCQDATREECDYCDDPGGCSESVTCWNVKEFDNTKCDPVGSWTCDPKHYGANDGCHCGCGEWDPDCVDGTADSCDVCGLPGACSATTTCPLAINPNDNWLCDFSGWTCDVGAFGDGICDCGCGIVDTDCATGNSLLCERCDAAGSCATGGCGDVLEYDSSICRPVAGWNCHPSFYNDGDYCDCGCGIVDPDCPDSNSTSCDQCPYDGACGHEDGACPYHLVPNDNSQCADGIWYCQPDLYGDGTCHCGCGLRDSDCANGTLAECDVCNAPFSCSARACGSSTIDPDDNSTCTVPPAWTCHPAFYGDGVCTCGCGVIDIDCPNLLRSSCGACVTSTFGGCASSTTCSSSGVLVNNNAQCM